MGRYIFIFFCEARFLIVIEVVYKKNIIYSERIIHRKVLWKFQINNAKENKNKFFVLALN